MKEIAYKNIIFWITKCYLIIGNPQIIIWEKVCMCVCVSNSKGEDYWTDKIYRLDSKGTIIPPRISSSCWRMSFSF